MKIFENRLVYITQTPTNRKTQDKIAENLAEKIETEDHEQVFSMFLEQKIHDLQKLYARQPENQRQKNLVELQQALEKKSHEFMVKYLQGKIELTTDYAQEKNNIIDETYKNLENLQGSISKNLDLEIKKIDKNNDQTISQLEHDQLMQTVFAETQEQVDGFHLANFQELKNQAEIITPELPEKWAEIFVILTESDGDWANIPSSEENTKWNRETILKILYNKPQDHLQTVENLLSKTDKGNDLPTKKEDLLRIITIIKAEALYQVQEYIRLNRNNQEDPVLVEAHKHIQDTRNKVKHKNFTDYFFKDTVSASIAGFGTVMGGLSLIGNIATTWRNGDFLKNPYFYISGAVTFASAYTFYNHGVIEALDRFSEYGNNDLHAERFCNDLVDQGLYNWISNDNGLSEMNFFFDLKSSDKKTFGHLQEAIKMQQENGINTISLDLLRTCGVNTDNWPPDNSMSPTQRYKLFFMLENRGIDNKQYQKIQSYFSKENREQILNDQTEKGLGFSDQRKIYRILENKIDLETQLKQVLTNNTKRTEFLSNPSILRYPYLSNQEKASLITNLAIIGNGNVQKQAIKALTGKEARSIDPDTTYLYIQKILEHSSETKVIKTGLKALSELSSVISPQLITNHPQWSQLNEDFLSNKLNTQLNRIALIKSRNELRAPALSLFLNSSFKEVQIATIKALVDTPSIQYLPRLLDLYKMNYNDPVLGLTLKNSIQNIFQNQKPAGDTNEQPFILYLVSQIPTKETNPLNPKLKEFLNELSNQNDFNKIAKEQIRRFQELHNEISVFPHSTAYLNKFINPTTKSQSINYNELNNQTTILRETLTSLKAGTHKIDNQGRLISQELNNFLEIKTKYEQVSLQIFQYPFGAVYLVQEKFKLNPLPKNERELRHKLVELQEILKKLQTQEFMIRFSDPELDNPNKLNRTLLLTPKLQRRKLNDFLDKIIVKLKKVSTPMTSLNNQMKILNATIQSKKENYIRLGLNITELNTALRDTREKLLRTYKLWHNQQDQIEEQLRRLQPFSNELRSSIKNKTRDTELPLQTRLSLLQFSNIDLNNIYQRLNDPVLNLKTKQNLNEERDIQVQFLLSLVKQSNTDETLTISALYGLNNIELKHEERQQLVKLTKKETTSPKIIKLIHKIID